MLLKIYNNMVIYMVIQNIDIDLKKYRVLVYVFQLQYHIDINIYITSINNVLIYQHE